MKFKVLSISLVTIILLSVFGFAVSAYTMDEFFRYGDLTDFGVINLDNNTVGRASHIDYSYPDNDTNNPDPFYKNRYAMFYDRFGQTSKLRLTIGGRAFKSFIQEFTNFTSNRFYFNFSNQRYYSSAISSATITVGFNDMSSFYPSYQVKKVQHTFDDYTYFENIVDVTLPKDFDFGNCYNITIDIEFASAYSLGGIWIEYAPLSILQSSANQDIIDSIGETFGGNYSQYDDTDIDSYNDLEDKILSDTNKVLNNQMNDFHITTRGFFAQFSYSFLAVSNLFNEFVSQIPFYNTLIIVSVGLGSLATFLGIFNLLTKEDKATKRKKGG